MARWATPEDVTARLRRRWDRGELLAARVRGEALFPLELPLPRPAPREITDDLSAVRDWAERLRAGSREGLGYGYELRWERVRRRVHGTNPLPVAAVVPSAEDALRLLRRRRDAERFDAMVAATRARLPELVEWLARRPLRALEHVGDWQRILAVLAWFRDHPRPGIYLRQLDIAGVDTKFIEARRGLFAELLDQVLPETAIDAGASGRRGFERRYGLRGKPATVRFRILDPRLSIRGLTDVSVPAEELHLAFGGVEGPMPERVFITENEVNGLAFPAHPGAVVIFGLGYGLERLAETPWLRRAEVLYWGDIDTHGFRMLDRLRQFLPQARSLLMDRATLEAHRALWGEEEPGKRYLGELERLTAAERALFDDLRHDRLGERVRLEQERVAFGCVERGIAQCG